MVILLAIGGWLGVNAIFEPFPPHPSTMLGYLGTALTAVAALQGPLILLTQRREAARDRAREIEAFHISMNTEADLHAIRTVLGNRDPESTTPEASTSD
jgi:uncharacterized membrane protein